MIIVIKLISKVKKSEIYKVKKQTAGLTVLLEVWSSGGITRGVIWDSIRGLVTLEHVRRNV